MSSFDKVVKLACKPKPAPPKAKYLDPIIAATWSEDGAIHDVCRALVPRLREPNAIIVFKALIVLHTMIRNGATDNVLSHLSASEVLRLRNVSAGTNWEGYNAPQNMQHYALYLDSRIRAYRELQHDAIRVQAETNRDMRLNHSLEEDMAYTTAPPKPSSTKSSKTPQRSKTIMGRKLRVMTVAKGLLRETKTVQNMIDALVECRFYLGDLEDELTITALRMLVKDLLILFQAGNEGVINVLEHYFEMSKYDAEAALSIYTHFCAQTERVVEYLGVAKKLQNLLNVPIPNLKHAPVSLASSLQEYLNDPNFEQNRIEYKANKQVSHRNAKDCSGAPPSAPSSAAAPSTSTTSATVPSVASSPPSASIKPEVNQAMADFFSSIEEEQTSMFNPATGSPTTTQPAIHNPFAQRQITGGISQLYGGQVQIQATGFNLPQPFQPAQPLQSTQPQPASPTLFGAQPQQAPQHRPFSTFIPSQPTGLQPAPTASFLQPQHTGANPFRQSVLMPQSTGIGAFNGSGITPVPPMPAIPTNSLFQLSSSQQPQSSSQQTLAPFMQIPQTLPSSAQHIVFTEAPARPASTPLTSSGTSQSSASPPIAQPVKSHQTGSRNPFGVPVTPAPPVPKPPTLLELSMGFGRLGLDGSQPSLQEAQAAAAISSHAQQASTVTSEATISSVASSFAYTTKLEENTAHSLGSNVNGLGSHSLNPQMTTSASTTSTPFVSSLSFEATGTTTVSQSSSHPVSTMSGPLKAQPTGFGGVKPFKPTSNFGASLLESLPPVPQSNSSAPDTSAAPAFHSSAPSLPINLSLNGSAFTSNLGGTLNSQPTGAPPSMQKVGGGFAPGVGLRPQATGNLGGANPFRATMFSATSVPSTVGSMSNPLMSSTSTPPFGGLSSGTALPAFTPGLGDSPFSSTFIHASQGTSNQLYQQQNAGTSLI